MGNLPGLLRPDNRVPTGRRRVVQDDALRWSLADSSPRLFPGGDGDSAQVIPEVHNSLEHREHRFAVIRNFEVEFSARIAAVTAGVLPHVGRLELGPQPELSPAMLISSDPPAQGWSEPLGDQAAGLPDRTQLEGGIGIELQ